MNIYWIKTGEFKLAIMPRPRGSDWLTDDIDFIQKAGIQVIASALTPGETEELSLTEERSYCIKRGVKFYSLPIEDRAVPASLPDFDAFIETLNAELRAGLAIAIHCRAGIGRSSLIAACLLIWRGMHEKDAMAAIEAARGCPVPDTQEQRTWIKNFGYRKHPELRS